MSDQQWGTSPQGENEAAKRQAEREKEFERKLDRDLEKHLGIPPRTPEAKENRGVRLEKDAMTRQMFTSNQPYDSNARRAAISAHLERMGISKELIQIRQIMEVGRGVPPGTPEVGDRRSPESKGAHMREKEARERDERGKGGRGD